MEEANKLIGTGKRHLVMGNAVEAVNVLQEACGMLGKKYGDTADECGEAFFWCGRALLDLARMENTVLGNALEGVPEEDTEDDEKPKDPNIESTENIDEKTRDELRVQVYDAMAEEKKSGDGGKSDNVDEVKSAKEEDETEQKMDIEDKENETKENNGEESKGKSKEATVKSEESTNKQTEKTEEPTEKQVETDTSEEPTEKPAETEKSEEPTKKQVEKDKSEEPTKKPAETDKSEEPTDKPAETDKSEEPTDKPAETDKSEEPTDKPAETDKSEEPTDKPAETDKSEEPTDKPAETDKLEEPTDKPAETDKLEEPTDKPAETDKLEEPTEPAETDKSEELTEEAEDDSEEGGDAEMEGDSEEQGEDTAEKESDDEEVGNLQLAWEMLEVAKVIYKRNETKEDQLMAAQAHLKLGEVSSESGNYAQALEDFQECLNLQLKHLDADSRLLAETHYQLGLTFGLNCQYAQAMEQFNNSISVIKSRLGKLQEVIDKAEGPEAVPEERTEMEELQALLPEIQDKVEDATEGLKSASTDAQAVKEALDGGSTSSALAESTGQNGDVPVRTKPANDTCSSSGSAPKGAVSDISHLVRKKRKPDESPVKEGAAKKIKQDEPATNGTHELAATEAQNGDAAEHGTKMEVESQ